MGYRGSNPGLSVLKANVLPNVLQFCTPDFQSPTTQDREQLFQGFSPQSLAALSLQPHLSLSPQPPLSVPAMPYLQGRLWAMHAARPPLTSQMAPSYGLLL